MKKVLGILLALILFLTSAGCGNDKPAENKPAKEQVKSTTMVFRNVSGKEWALSYGLNRSDDYLNGELQLDYDDFAVKAGEQSQGHLIFPKNLEGFSEPSENAFAGKIFLLAGKVNPDNTGYSVEVTYKQDILISAEYGTTVMIEWDGASFRPTK